MKDISTTYLDRYRRRLADLDLIEQEIHAIRERYDQELSGMAERRLRVNNEIAEMRKIITTMIDHGVDPVEAKLRNEQNNETIWDTQPKMDWNEISITVDDSYTNATASIDLSGIYVPTGSTGSGY